MEYIKVLATDSTNPDLKRRYRADVSIPNTSLMALQQTQGRGQRGTVWYADNGKNLTFSVLLKNINLKPTDHFNISMVISLAILSYLKLNVKNFHPFIKWPNDILADDKKICGILIEPLIQKNRIQHVVVGIGLNVNQTDFPTATHAASLASLTDQTYSVEKLWKELSAYLETFFYTNLALDTAQLIERYLPHLYRLGEVSRFEFPNGLQKSGTIQGILANGKLLVKFEEQLQEFDLKEIKLIY